MDRCTRWSLIERYLDFTVCLERIGDVDTLFTFLNDNSPNAAQRHRGTPDDLRARHARILPEIPSVTWGFKLLLLSD